MKRRAYMAIDALFGIAIVVGLTAGLAVALRQAKITEEGLADSRSALHLAEHTLLNLQHGQPVPMAAGSSVEMMPIDQGTAPSGFRWVKVNATVRGHHQFLFGVVPSSTLFTGKNA